MNRKTMNRSQGKSRKREQLRQTCRADENEYYMQLDMEQDDKQRRNSEDWSSEQSSEQEQKKYQNAVYDEPQENWVNEDTWRFIQNLSFNGYVLAGNSVANMVQKIPLQGDLDFWAKNWRKFEKALNQIGQHYEHFHIYPSMIQMYNTEGNLPRVNLILTDLTPMQTIQKFDFDYCRCYWSPNNPVIFGTGSQQCIKTKIIRHVNSRRRIMRKRILKAIMYGYTFQTKFWTANSILLNNKFLDARSNYTNTIPYPVKIEDLNLKRFRLREVNLEITNIDNVKQTIQELRKQFELHAKKKNIKLPILLKIEKKNFNLVLQYAQQIITLNPLSDAHYMRVKLGTRFAYRDPSVNLDFRNPDDDDYSSSSEQVSSSQGDNVETKNQQPSIPSKKKKKKYEKTEVEIVNLNEDQTAYLKMSTLPKDLIKKGIKKFDKMWDLHPKQRHKIIMFEKQIQVARYSKSYLNTPIDLSHTSNRSYMYSGFDTTKNTEDLPAQFKPFYNYMKQIDDRFNQVIVNWYQNEDDYIAHHSDCQIGMIQDAEVAIISFYPDALSSSQRAMEIVPKETYDTKSKKWLVSLENGSILTMCGKTQQLFKHGIRKSETKKPPRISISFRQMDPNLKNQEFSC